MNRYQEIEELQKVIIQKNGQNTTQNNCPGERDKCENNNMDLGPAGTFPVIKRPRNRKFEWTTWS